MKKRWSYKIAIKLLRRKETKKKKIVEKNGSNQVIFFLFLFSKWKRKNRISQRKKILQKYKELEEKKNEKVIRKCLALLVLFPFINWKYFLFYFFNRPSSPCFNRPFSLSLTISRLYLRIPEFYSSANAARAFANVRIDVCLRMA